MAHSTSSTIALKRDLCRLAQFGANISDAHSCFILLPEWLLSSHSEDASTSNTLVIGGYHSLSTSVLEKSRLTNSSGLIGWVAKHTSPIHVSPFERDSRTLGIYRDDQMLKSFIGVPVQLDKEQSGERLSVGVIACDSKKSFAFSKLQGKLIEGLAKEVSRTVQLSVQLQTEKGFDLPWHSFLARGEDLIHQLGKSSVEVIRLRPINVDELEKTLGSDQAINLLQQVNRLVKQALPNHFPTFRMPQGDLVAFVDNMMSSLYRRKVDAICDHLSKRGNSVRFSFSSASFRNRALRHASLEEMVQATCPGDGNAAHLNEVQYEYGRA